MELESTPLIPTFEFIFEKAFIRVLDPPDRQETLEFNSMPKITSHSVSPNYQTVAAMGTTGLSYQWRNNNPQNLGVSIKFVAQKDARKEVIDKVNWCLALVYPISLDVASALHRPPRIMLVIGKWLLFTGIVMNASASYGEAVDTDGLFPLEATVEMTLERAKPYSEKDSVVHFGFVDVDYDSMRSMALKGY